MIYRFVCHLKRLKVVQAKLYFRELRGKRDESIGGGEAERDKLCP
jgi:hypothetical protein